MQFRSTRDSRKSSRSRRTSYSKRNPRGKETSITSTIARAIVSNTRTTRTISKKKSIRKREKFKTNSNTSSINSFTKKRKIGETINSKALSFRVERKGERRDKKLSTNSSFASGGTILKPILLLNKDIGNTTEDR